MDAPVVLISDDDEPMVRLLERQAQNAGLRVVLDLKSEAVQLSSLLRPAVVVLDLFQSKYGLDMLRELKADPRNEDVEVVMVSGIGADVMKDSCVALGAADFVSKPLDATFLANLARRASQVATARAKRKPAPSRSSA